MQPNRFRLAILLASAVIPISVDANTEIAYGVADFDGPNACPGPSSHSAHLFTPAIFNEVFKELKAAGKWSSASVRVNTNVRGSMFTDASRKSTGADSATGGADSADVFFIHTHGTNNLKSPSARSHLSMGTSEQCRANTEDHMLWNANTDIAVVKACRSADREVWLTGAYMKFITPSSSLSVWNGVHGDSSCMITHTFGDVDDYARSSKQDGVGENWLDEFYADWVGFDNDDCPVSIVMGDTKDKRNSMFRFGGWLDRKNTGVKNKSSYFFIADCDPENGIHLPD